MGHRSFVLASVAALAACTSSVDGELRVDGEVFEVTHCDSLERIGLAGVDLVLEDDRRVRLFVRPGLGLFVTVLGPDRLEELGDCAQAAFEEQGYELNDVRAIRGTASLRCVDRSPTVEGRVEFEGCA